MNWTEFLQNRPILRIARETLDDDEFLAFLDQLYKRPHPEGFTYDLAWHAFEEIGWCEGNHYCRHGSPEYALTMFKPKTYQKEIAPRLALRQKHWKTAQKEHIAAHLLLIDLLPEKAKQNQLLQGLLP